MASANGYSERCDEWFRIWIHALGLSGWTIDVKYVHPIDCEIDGNACSGTCTVSRPLQQAVIKIAVPPTDEDRLEQTVVHELLHLYFDLEDFQNPSSYGYVRSEQGVDTIANLLVRMRRENEPRPAKTPRKPNKRRKLPR